MTMVLAYIGIGANLGNPRATVATAIDDCRSIEGTRLLAVSSPYRSAPVDSSGPDYVNAVVKAETTLTPLHLLAALQQIENRHGRQRSFKNAPRTLDLDLLLYGQQQIEMRELVVPHPRMHQRAFVLLPLLELEPRLTIPGLGLAEKLLAEVAGQPVERIEA